MFRKNNHLRQQTFSIKAPAALGVQLAGDFTQWQEQPINMQKGADGMWRVTVELEPGKHQYRFLVDGQWRDDPDCALAVPNPHGSQNSVREVNLTTEQLEALGRLDACTVANAIEAFHERLRNEGIVDHSIRSIFPCLKPMVGYAATVKIRGSELPFGDGVPYPDRTDWWNYMLSVPTPRVIVVEDCATRTGFGSFLGAVHTNIARALGCVGAVTNGSVRDIPALESLAFPVFAGSICVSHAYIHIVEMGGPVEIGGLKIKSGDLLHGDIHGVQRIPLDAAAKVPAVASKILQQEEEIIALCRSSEFSIERLRMLVSKNSR